MAAVPNAAIIKTASAPQTGAMNEVICGRPFLLVPR